MEFCGHNLLRMTKTKSPKCQCLSVTSQCLCHSLIVVSHLHNVVIITDISEE